MRINVTKRAICAVIALIMAMSAFSVFAAAQTVEPCFNNVERATNRYTADANVFSKAIITTYVEKKVLGLFWSRVDIGQNDNKWIDVIYDNVYTGTHSVQLSDKGTYRVTSEFVVYGSGGPADTVTETATTEYK